MATFSSPFFKKNKNVPYYPRLYILVCRLGNQWSKKSARRFILPQKRARLALCLQPSARFWQRTMQGGANAWQEGVGPINLREASVPLRDIARGLNSRAVGFRADFLKTGTENVVGLSGATKTSYST